MGAQQDGKPQLCHMRLHAEKSVFLPRSLTEWLEKWKANKQTMC